MKYPIIYQIGQGVKEKGIIRDILKNLPEISVRFNVTVLKTDIDRINDFDNLLITEEITQLLTEFELENNIILERVSRLDEIKDIINKTLLLKADKITVEILKQIQELKTEFDIIYLQYSQDEIKFDNLRLLINKILSKHGSLIDEFHITRSEFGDMQTTGRTSLPVKLSDSDDDFM